MSRNLSAVRSKREGLEVLSQVTHDITQGALQKQTLEPMFTDRSN